MLLARLGERSLMSAKAGLLRVHFGCQGAEFRISTPVALQLGGSRLGKVAVIAQHALRCQRVFKIEQYFDRLATPQAIGNRHVVGKMLQLAMARLRKLVATRLQLLQLALGLGDLSAELFALSLEFRKRLFGIREFEP